MPEEKEAKFDMQEFVKHAKGEAEPEEIIETNETHEEAPEKEVTSEPEVIESKAEPSKQEINTATESKLDEYWQDLEESGVEIPDFIKTGKKEDGTPITKKEKAEALRQYYLDLSQFGATEEDDAIMREYMMASIQPNFDRKKWLKEQLDKTDVLSLSSKEFMRQVFKSQAKQNGFDWTDDDIEAKLNAMSKIDLDMQANEYKKNLKKFQAQTVEEKSKEDLKKKTTELEKINKSITEGVSQWITKNQDKRKLGGFEFDEAEAEELHKELADFMTKKIVDLPNGQKGIYSQADLIHGELLSNDEMAMNFSIYLWLVHKKKLEGFLSDKLEAKKKQIEKSLADSPEDDTTGLSGNVGFDQRSFRTAAQTKRG